MTKQKLVKTLKKMNTKPGFSKTKDLYTEFLKIFIAITFKPL